jgi:hypothetical protein
MPFVIAFVILFSLVAYIVVLMVAPKIEMTAEDIASSLPPLEPTVVEQTSDEQEVTALM